MSDHTENTLRAVVKALTDVVGPAVDKADPLANEQLRLVVDYLEFLRSRLDALYGRERFELRHHLTLASSLADMKAPCSAAAADALTGAIAAGEEAYTLAGTTTPALRTATARLAAAIATLVREAAALDAAVRQKIEREVLAATDERIVFERSWYLPLGFDPSPGDVLPLAAAMAQTGTAPTSPQRH
jgi:hypothetical protein